ncbi:DEAD/DEAH box helicase [Corynebacterium antarcticum]|uniref:DEAD/DEAH box helicase n=1 Tax=Corynebacterium antarcticum TaxID=2800405 RepID=UPI002006C836|nr:DEAD/DEAH box helicase family protein [Corynebacterium antarcticum]MCK7660045.1 DEAD/DEAH box helicase family protein [Corynebacterium antarcticum]
MNPIITYDENLVTEIAAKFDLRKPNAEALTALVKRIETGDFKPTTPLVLNLATGVGKTYILASFIEYLRRQGVKNVMVVTPSTVVQKKTVNDLSDGSNRYIGGFDIPPAVVTPGNMYSVFHGMQAFSGTDDGSTVYVFNVQQLFPPKEGGPNEASGTEAARRKVYRFQEESGALAERLINLEDLVIIADESHLFGRSAKVFRDSLANLDPAVTVGLTASPDKDDTIVFKYPLWRAIDEQYVKQPVLVFRQSGYATDDRQLQDAVSLLRFKEEQYAQYRDLHPDGPQIKPLLFVVCADVNHATETADELRGTHLPNTPDGPQVLQVDHQHDDDVTNNFLQGIDRPGSPIRAIVSVNKLREGWDTKRIAVMCTLRTMGSEVLTQQVMGRGLRLPFGKITGNGPVDQLDIISHKSFVSLLKSEDVLREFGIEEEMPGPSALADLLMTPGGDTTDGGPVGSTTGATGATGGDSGPTGGNQTGSVPNGGGEGRTVVARGLDDDDPVTPSSARAPVVIEVNPSFADTYFLFPTSTLTKTQKAYDLTELEETALKAQAIGVTNAKEHLERRLINADGTEKKITAEADDRQVVDSYHQETEEVEAELLNRVIQTRSISPSRKNINQLKNWIIPRFMDFSGIKQWTENSKESAARLLTELVAREAKTAARRNTSEEVIITPKRIPIRQKMELPSGTKVDPLLDLDGPEKPPFDKSHYYGTWKRGLFTHAKFDSFSAEYRLAHLFNLDPNVQWWTRIYREQGATIAYTTRDNYVPDFVVQDTAGTYWIVEGKADDKKGDETVELKRKAAERLIRELASQPGYVDQVWGYVIAYESDIANAGSLSALTASNTLATSQVIKR